MSVQRWAIIVDNALRGVTEVRKVAARDGEWVEYQAHAAEVARLTASRDDWKARSESFDRQGYEVQRNLDAAREEVARLRGAARKVLECADKGIGVARLSADDMHWLCPRCNAKGTCKPGCALNALLGALDELAALAPAARKDPS